MTQDDNMRRLCNAIALASHDILPIAVERVLVDIEAQCTANLVTSYHSNLFEEPAFRFWARQLIQQENLDALKRLKGLGYKPISETDLRLLVKHPAIAQLFFDKVPNLHLLMESNSQVDSDAMQYLAVRSWILKYRDNAEYF